MPKALALLAGRLLPASKIRRSSRRFSPICRERIPRIQRVCGQKAGHRLPTCLADPIKPFTPFQWQLLERESQDAGWSDARGRRANGTGEGERLDSECGMMQDFQRCQGAGPFVTRG